MASLISANIPNISAERIKDGEDGKISIFAPNAGGQLILKDDLSLRLRKRPETSIPNRGLYPAIPGNVQLIDINGPGVEGDLVRYLNNKVLEISDYPGLISIIISLPGMQKTMNYTFVQAVDAVANTTSHDAMPDLVRTVVKNGTVQMQNVGLALGKMAENIFTEGITKKDLDLRYTAVANGFVRSMIKLIWDALHAVPINDLDSHSAASDVNAFREIVQSIGVLNGPSGFAKIAIAAKRRFRENGIVAENLHMFVPEYARVKSALRDENTNYSSAGPSSNIARETPSEYRKTMDGIPIHDLINYKNEEGVDIAPFDGYITIATAYGCSTIHEEPVNYEKYTSVRVTMPGSEQVIVKEMKDVIYSTGRYDYYGLSSAVLNGFENGSDDIDFNGNVPCLSFGERERGENTIFQMRKVLDSINNAFGVLNGVFQSNPRPFQNNSPIQRAPDDLLQNSKFSLPRLLKSLRDITVVEFRAVLTLSTNVAPGANVLAGFNQTQKDVFIFLRYQRFIDPELQMAELVRLKNDIQLVRVTYNNADVFAVPTDAAGGLPPAGAAGAAAAAAAAAAAGIIANPGVNAAVDADDVLNRSVAVDAIANYLIEGYNVDNAITDRIRETLRRSERVMHETAQLITVEDQDTIAQIIRQIGENRRALIQNALTGLTAVNAAVPANPDTNRRMQSRLFLFDLFNRVINRLLGSESVRVDGERRDAFRELNLENVIPGIAAGVVVDNNPVGTGLALMNQSRMYLPLSLLEKIVADRDAVTDRLSLLIDMRIAKLDDQNLAEVRERMLGRPIGMCYELLEHFAFESSQNQFALFNLLCASISGKNLTYIASQNILPMDNFMIHVISQYNTQGALVTTGRPLLVGHNFFMEITANTGLETRVHALKGMIGAAVISAPNVFIVPFAHIRSLRGHTNYLFRTSADTYETISSSNIVREVMGKTDGGRGNGGLIAHNAGDISLDQLPECFPVFGPSTVENDPLCYGESVVNAINDNALVRGMKNLSFMRQACNYQTSSFNGNRTTTSFFQASEGARDIHYAFKGGKYGTLPFDPKEVNKTF